MLPKGSCVAKGAQLDGDKVAQGKWDSWCDVNCVASKWGGLGGKGGCRDGSETGSVGCGCKQGLTPVSVKTGRPLGAAAQGGNTEHLGSAQGGNTEHQAVPELVKANAPQPQAQRAAAAAEAADHGPKWIASHGGAGQQGGQQTAAQAVAAGTHSAQYLCDHYGRQCGAAERERGRRGRPTVRKDSRGKQGGCPKSKDCWGADAALPECIACIESEQQVSSPSP